ncbi:MAG: leucine-rich repeat domain-containing protein, partial [Ruminococcaceae bacterium]|nr:leucine-rich repeat domain-containing protein [Oscillospiraceae bacterium]
KTIANSAFYDCSSLESIIIPNGVTTVGEFAFYSCSRLKSANLPDSITNIGKYAFYKCEKLANIIIPNSISKIDDHTFYNCFSLSSVTIGKNVIKIGDSAFFNCYNLKNITIPNGVTSINDHAFYCCSRLKSITIPSSIISVDYKAFYGCNNLTDVWYDGSKDEKNRINISAENDYFINAVWHYNRVDECIHNYTTVTNKSTLTSNGSIVTKCSVCGTPLNTFSLAKIASVTTTKKVTYNGKTNTPTVIVKDANGKIISSSNYNLKYASGRKNYGKYRITGTVKGNYSGSESIYFEIVPKNSKISKLTAKKKSLIVKIKRNKSVSGYQIQYSLKKNFKGTKTVTLKKNSITSKTIKKLKAKKFYYVRVRTYKTYKGKKYYSAWSSAKKKKTK